MPRREAGLAPRSRANSLGKTLYIVYICMRVGIYSAGGGPALVQQGENGRGPKIGINFSRRQGGRGAHPTETGKAKKSAGGRGAHPTETGKAKKSARRLLKLRRFLGKTVEKGASSAHGQIPSPF